MTRRTIELFCFLAALVLAALSFHAWLASRDEQQRLQSTLAAQKEILDAANAREKDRNAALNTTLAQIAKLKSATQSPQDILRVLKQQLQLPQPITLAATNPATGSRSAAFTPSDTRGVSRANLNLPLQLPLQLPSPLSLTSSSNPSSQQGTVASGNRPPPPASDFRSAGFQPAQLPLQLPSSSQPPAQIPAADLKPLFDFVQDCRACQAQLVAAQHNSADDAAKIVALTRERDAAITASKGGTFLRRLRRNALWLAVGAAAGYAAAKR